MENNTKKIKKGKIKKKNLTILTIGLIIIILIPLIIYNNRNTNNNKIKKIIYNKNKSFTKEQTIEGIIFSDIKCSYDGKNSLISYNITNQTDKEINLKNYKVLVKDKKGTIITNIFIDFNRKIPPKEKMTYKNSIVGVDLSNAHSMELKLNTKNGK